MNSRWQGVWNQRKPPDDKTVGLRDLLDLDGYDTAVSQITPDNMRSYARTISEILGITTGSSVYEVGCGAGAFLYALREQIEIWIGGCDYSSALIDVTRRVLPAGDFAVLEAAELPQVPYYDLVISNGVFHYFPDLDYAGRVLDLMIAKSRRAVAVLDIPDLSRRDAAERMRRDKFKADEYERRYAGLEHLYYPSGWFLDLAATHNVDCRIFPSQIPNYIQSKFRFSAVLVKR